MGSIEKKYRFSDGIAVNMLQCICTSETSARIQQRDLNSPILRSLWMSIVAAIPSQIGTISTPHIIIFICYKKTRYKGLIFLQKGTFTQILEYQQRLS